MINECVMCGEILGHDGKFCGPQCADEYQYQNRTCEVCGGEFWDGGASCDCDEDNDPEEDIAPPEASAEFDTWPDDLPY